jgi:hypothetical protein
VIGIFRQKSPANIVLLLILGLLIKMPLFLFPKPVVATAQDGALYRWLIASLPPDPSARNLAAGLLAFILVYIQALLLNYLVNEHRMTARQTYLPAMAFLLITSLLPDWTYLSAPLVANGFLLWAFIKLFRLYNLGAAQGAIFNIGLILGIASFIYFSSAALVICLLLGLMILRPFRLKEWLLLLLGAATPYYFYGVYLYLTDAFSVPNLFPAIRATIPFIRSSVWLALSVTLLCVPFLIGGYHVQAQLRKMLIQVRKNWSVLLLWLFLALFVPFVNSTVTFSGWLVALAPFAAFHGSGYFYAARKWVPMALFILTVAYILFGQYGTGMWR